MMAKPDNRDRAIICNPIDLAYRFQDIHSRGARSVHREAADPSVVHYQGRYYLFASMSAGFWHSNDLVEWTFKETERLPALDYAPDVRVIDGALCISASRKTNSPFFRSEAPLDDDFVRVSEGFPFWDPNLFQDDDSSVYLYWGCSNVDPLFGVQIDPATMTPIGQRVALLAGNPEQHGWERVGENYERASLAVSATEPGSERPYIEGAWMTAHANKYYLQYAGPGTEWNTYADGYYTSDSPLGPFTYASNSPFSSKPGGFITGAGHGSTFQDIHGNWWHAATMRISVNHAFERRIGIFPAGFDEDGILFCNQNFADYPVTIHDRRFDPWTESFAGWMLQSYNCQRQLRSDRWRHVGLTAGGK
ncbi:family 43 glycosylhydrolase [Arthrobacter sp. MMS18-M83]|uniref:family 43 glycosylhydrolase n=1 Tax=Arthrobacter sp. MMS18-M83 TaxID=2996261 RepID=UPI00227D551F|nr:family 43 glycosylhydrolase [Arthrobacter sp. MMS18-M83]WAH97323.1 family 43 glycosylhydrolase [Arthrobacter sp. MMS18-M83]